MRLALGNATGCSSVVVGEFAPGVPNACCCCAESLQVNAEQLWRMVHWALPELLETLHCNSISGPTRKEHVEANSMWLSITASPGIKAHT
jgi:hypothetical protein